MTGTENEQMNMFDVEDTAVKSVHQYTPEMLKQLNDAVNQLDQDKATTEPIEPEEPLNEFGFTESEWNAPIFDGGPTRREIEEWKQKYGAVYFTPFEEEIFVWRTLGRDEYKVMIDDRSLTTMDREELMCEKVVLFPRNYTRAVMKSGKAGIPSLLAEMIMDKSGFVASSAPIKL